MFKKYVKRVPAILCSLFVSTNLYAQAPDNVKAAFVGHSLINYDMPHMLQQLVASADGLSLEKAVQVNNGAPLKYNWQTCHEADFSGQWPPQNFVCDEFETNSGAAAYNALIATDANNSIHSNHVWNQTQVYLEEFTELMLSQQPEARSFLYTSWEGLDLSLIHI